MVTELKKKQSLQEHKNNSWKEACAVLFELMYAYACILVCGYDKEGHEEKELPAMLLHLVLSLTRETQQKMNKLQT